MNRWGTRAGGGGWDMGQNRYDVVQRDGGWIIRRNALDAGHCADRASALTFASALARGDRRRKGDAPRVRLVDEHARPLLHITVDT